MTQKTLTRESLEILREAIDLGLSPEELYTKGLEICDLQDARQQAVQRIANEHFVIQQDVLSGKYDSVLETISILTKTGETSILEE